jgi:hypothetical protein
MYLLNEFQRSSLLIIEMKRMNVGIVIAISFHKILKINGFASLIFPINIGKVFKLF